jgi:HEAT repeat protein
MNEVNQLALAALLQQKSTSERIQNVLATLDQKSPNEKVLSDLVLAMQIDPSVNVRLSAVEAVTPHAGDKIVRAGLLTALPRESAPLVQVAMIELLATIRETEATPLFERLSRDETADKDVRESARRGLALLRTPSPTDTLKNNQPSNPVLS